MIKLGWTDSEVESCSTTRRSASVSSSEEEASRNAREDTPFYGSCRDRLRTTWKVEDASDGWKRGTLKATAAPRPRKNHLNISPNPQNESESDTSDPGVSDGLQGREPPTKALGPERQDPVRARVYCTGCKLTAHLGKSSLV